MERSEGKTDGGGVVRTSQNYISWRTPEFESTSALSAELLSSAVAGEVLLRSYRIPDSCFWLEDPRTLAFVVFGTSDADETGVNPSTDRQSKKSCHPCHALVIS